MANLVWDFLQVLSRRFSRTASPIAEAAPLTATDALAALSAALDARIARYLEPRYDQREQHDHLRHVAARARWLYAHEVQRTPPGGAPRPAPHDTDLIEACVLSHDMGKWIPREELQALFTEDHARLTQIFHELNLSPAQTELFLLGIRRRLNLPRDGYIPEYDAAHHLVSAYILVTDPALGFHALPADDQAQLIRMIIGHQFGSYFKGSLLNLSLHDFEVTTGMLVDTARSDRLAGDLLSSVFHDADIADLLYVGSIEPLTEEGQEKYHCGGLVKILMINYSNLLHAAPHAPANQAEILRSCQTTVNYACKEFLTPTAVERGNVWREEARGFLNYLQTASIQETLQASLTNPADSIPERLDWIRAHLYLCAQNYLREFPKH